MGAPACSRKALSVAATWDSDLGAVDDFLGCSEATTAARQPTCFSNRSPTTDLFAAGAFVTSTRSEEHTSELQSLMRISYAVFCLQKKICISPFYTCDTNNVQTSSCIYT